MRDYQVLSMDDVGSPITDHGVALALEDIPWAGKQLWDSDAATTRNGKYYLFYPARDKENAFRIGVAVSDVPERPFKSEPNAIEGNFSIDPASFVDDDGEAYLYFGGIWGGQLQCWTSGKFDKDAYFNMEAKSGIALYPKVAKLSKDMLSFDGEVKDVVILDKEGKPLAASDHDRRFFEAAWMHKYNEKYYLSYSTGDTHYLCYSIGDSPFGPFPYAGRR